ncbi:nuclear transport factor 2 family protein [Rhodopirellula sp. P2]|uniref:nuclear transport factor 2 family protein n=1 Tax=Rhodopirellula sp. P2 TaxID=2127060 RepID=UPI00236880C6|nr:nuclear transport factor 2 family protein [Rhodopirellula sp. P2]WDQ17833.1 nuclear transport factor 2 family protein [Rhodopirellula sp. P2]
MNSSPTLLLGACLGIAILGSAASGIVAQDSQPAVAEATTADSPIRERLKQYAEAFNDRKLEALSQFLAADVRYLDASSGRKANSATELIDLIRTAVETEPTLKLSANVEDIEQPETNQAIVRGTTTLTSDQAPQEVSSFEITLAKPAADWLITSITESTPSSIEPANPVESLGWLVGTWKEDSENGLQSNIDFLPGRRFIRRTFQTGADAAPVGYEMIGYDPQSNRVKSWTYFADGSFGNGHWAGEKDHWRMEMTQTLADGGQATATCIVRPVDRDTMTVRIISRVVNGEPLPNGQAVTLRRQTEADTTSTTEPSPNTATPSGANQ